MMSEVGSKGRPGPPRHVSCLPQQHTLGGSGGALPVPVRKGYIEAAIRGSISREFAR